MFIPIHMFARLTTSTSNLALGALILGFIGFLFLLRSERVSGKSLERTEKEIQASIRTMGAKIGTLQRIERTLRESGYQISNLKLKITPYPELCFNIPPTMGAGDLYQLFCEALDTNCFLMSAEDDEGDENGFSALFSIEEIGNLSLDFVRSEWEGIVNCQLTVSEDE